MSSLWLRIQELYMAYPGPACLDNTTVRMIKPEGARAAKMKCYGSETRGLLPVVHHLVREMLGDDGSMKVGTEHLSACYPCLSATTPFAADRLAEHCNRFAALYVALEHVTDGVSRTKPELQMFQELLRDVPSWVSQVLGHIGTRSSVACWSAQPVVGVDSALDVHCSLSGARLALKDFALPWEAHPLAHTHRQKRLLRIVIHEMTDTGINRHSP